MKTIQIVFLILGGILLMCNMGTCSIEWDYLNNVEKVAEGGYRVTGPDAWMQFKPFDPPVTAEKSYLSIEVSASQPTQMGLTWLRVLEQPIRVKGFPLQVNSNGEYVTQIIDLGVLGPYRSKDILRLNITAAAGLKFDVKEVKLISKDQVPEKQLTDMLDFHCFTSKLHYLPGERIEYKATFLARNYPDTDSSKVLTVKVFDKDNKCVSTNTQQYGFQPLHQVKELWGVLQIDKPLKPGKYRLEGISKDQRSSMIMTSTHEFGIQGKSDPYVYETPFKFVKDFCIIKGPDNLWHVFSITGDFVGSHEWYEDGQERTFSHGTSPDLRHWTYHPPVLSISNDKYPDGNGKFKDRNIWAPHVIKHGDTYYMFYTSVNQPTTQSISLATSKDLFNWTDYEKNPVLTFEGVDWAAWNRNAGGAGRDPMILEDNGKFYMYVTADANSGENRGVVAVAESDDLFNWKNHKIAVRGKIASESPQVWKTSDTYYMVTSSHGAATYTSKNPVTGWEPTPFPRAPTFEVEHYVPTSGGYAEEVARLDDGSLLMAALTWRHWGNSIYFFKVKADKEGKPIGYESPFKIN